MTQKDKWAKRDCVVRYYEWANQARTEATGDPYHYLNPKQFLGYYAFVHIQMPKSWSAKKRKAMEGRLHMQKPDKDNVEKGINDALFADDSALAIGGVMAQYWGYDDFSPCIDIFLIPNPGEEEIQFLHLIEEE